MSHTLRNAETVSVYSRIGSGLGRDWVVTLCSAGKAYDYSNHGSFETFGSQTDHFKSYTIGCLNLQTRKDLID